MSAPLVPVDDAGAEVVFARPLVVVAMLAGAAGFVDAFAFLWLGVFVANMTGNIVFLGLAIGGASAKGGESGLAIAAFVVGAGAGVLLRSAGRRRGAPAGTILPLLAVCLLLAAVVVAVTLSPPEPDAARSAATVVALVALAMANGLQAFVVTRVGGLSTPTTYATGTVVASSSAAVAALADHGRPEATFWRRRWAVAVVTPAAYLVAAAAYALLRDVPGVMLAPLVVMLVVLGLAVAGGRSRSSV